MSLDIPNIYNDPILMRKRKGTSIDPYVKIKESFTVDAHYVLLSEIPNRYNKVKVTIPNSDKELHEVKKEHGLLRENEYRVDYTNGIVYIHESLKGLTLDFEYTGEGVYLFPDSRVYYTADKKRFPNLRDKIADIDRAILVERHRIDEQLRSHPQPSEVVDLRIDYNGKIYNVAKDRIDAEQQKIEEAYVDAKGVRYNSLKERIDSLQLAMEEEVDEQKRENTKIWSEIEIIPGKISLEVGRLEEKVNQEITKLTSRIDLVPEQITLKVEELREYVDGELYHSYSQIDLLKDQINLKVDANGVVSSINLSKEGVRISGNKIQITGQTHIDNAVIKSAHIESIDASKIRAGILRSQNDNTTWNLNTGNLVMRDASLVLGGGAKIELTDPGNRIVYTQLDYQEGQYHSAGIGIGRNINDRFPFAYLGTVRGTGLHAMDSTQFSGFIANTISRQDVDNIGNSVVGDVFHVRDKAVSYSIGFRFDLSGSVKYMRGMNTSKYTYDLGTSGSQFRNVFTQNVRSTSSVNVRDGDRSSGWMIQTRYAGDGSAITLRGLNGGRYNYSIGRRENYNRITSIFLKNRPNVSSDSRLKEDIEGIPLGLDFVNKLDVVAYRLKPNFSNMNENKKQYGLIAQQVKKALVESGVDINDITMIDQDDEGYYALEYEQFIAPLIKAVQELSDKVKKLENQIIQNGCDE